MYIAREDVYNVVMRKKSLQSALYDMTLLFFLRCKSHIVNICLCEPSDEKIHTSL